MKTKSETGIMMDENIASMLPKSFVAYFIKACRFHDWFLVNFYCGNTGRMVEKYSRRGGSTFQIELFCGSGEYVLVEYKNVRKLIINYAERSTHLTYYHVGFGMCVHSDFSLCKDSYLRHKYSFGDGGFIMLEFEKLHHKVIHYEYYPQKR